MEAEHDTDFICAGDPTRRGGTERIWMAEYIRSTEEDKSASEGGRTDDIILDPISISFLLPISGGKRDKSRGKRPKIGRQPCEIY